MRWTRSDGAGAGLTVCRGRDKGVDSLTEEFIKNFFVLGPVNRFFCELSVVNFLVRGCPDFKTRKSLLRGYSLSCFKPWNTSVSDNNELNV